MATITQWSSLGFPLVNTGQVYTVGIVFPGLCTIFAALRFYARSQQKVGVGLDDWLIFIALVNIIGIGICFVTGAAMGVMGPATPLPNTQEGEIMYLQSYKLVPKIEFACYIFLNLGCGCVKLSVVSFSRRVFLVHKTSWFGYATTAVAVLIFAWMTAFFFALIFACGTHVDARWGTEQQAAAQCANPIDLEEAVVISSFLTDLIALILPLPMVWRLQMSLSRKFQISGIFLVGLLALAASIARIAFFARVAWAGINGTYDPARTVTTSLWWSLVEGGMAYLTACLPTLQVLIDRPALRSLSYKIRSKASIPSISFRNAKTHTNLRSESTQEFECRGQPSRDSDDTLDMYSNAALTAV